MRDLDPEDLRAKIRGGEYTDPTSGLAPGHVQTNLVVLPEDYAFDFLKFCVRKPEAVPGTGNYRHRLPGTGGHGSRGGPANGCSEVPGL